MTAEATDNRHQILALTGGGYRGVFTAAFLARCEAEWSFDWRARFQLFAGASVGALLAAGLASGQTAASLLAAMTTNGSSIFPERWFHSVRRLVGRAPYETEPLREAARQVLGALKDARLSELPGRLVVTAVNYSTGTTEVFHSAGVDPDTASDVRLIDAILASAAAPTYFPMVKIGPHEFADGGLVANAPDLVGLISAIKLQRTPLARCYMLSVGTASWKGGVALRETPDNPGIIAALRGRRLVQTTMAAQESLALRQVKVLMGDRHLRVDREPDQMRIAEIKAMDNARPEAHKALVYLADEEWKARKAAEQAALDTSLRDFFAR